MNFAIWVATPLLINCNIISWLQCLMRTCLHSLHCLWNSWWRHQMETFSALLAICAGNSPVTGEFTAQRPVTRRFEVFFDLRLNKRLSKQSRGWWFETTSRPLWRHYNVILNMYGALLAELVFHVYGKHGFVKPVPGQTICVTRSRWDNGRR